MAGLVPAGVEREVVQPLFIENLRWAAAAKSGHDLLIEPINTRDIPRFFLKRQDHAHEIVEAVGAPNLKVQMDLCHCQNIEGKRATKDLLTGGGFLRRLIWFRRWIASALSKAAGSQVSRPFTRRSGCARGRWDRPSRTQGRVARYPATIRGGVVPPLRCRTAASSAHRQDEPSRS